MTVKKLISILEQFENKFLEVEIFTLSESKMIHEIDSVYQQNKKVLIRAKDK